jgi:hypothetical protein
MSESADETLRLAYINLLPQAFGDTIDNTYFPLKPGTTYIYRGSTEGLPMRLRATVTNEIKEIMGVRTLGLRERHYEDGEWVEDSYNWYAQDKAGNVWFFGEDVRDLQDGEVVSRDGAWQAGVDGAMPGLFMRAYPGVGDHHLLENAPGIAEDQARVLSLNEKVKTPYRSFGDALVTEDFSPLDAGEIEQKTYVPGIGLVMEDTIEGDDDNLRLAYVIFQES